MNEHQPDWREDTTEFDATQEFHQTEETTSLGPVAEKLGEFSPDFVEPFVVVPVDLAERGLHQTAKKAKAVAIGIGDVVISCLRAGFMGEH